MQRSYISAVLLIAGCALSAAATSVCNPPPGLQTKLQAHPTGDTYAEVGMWYSNHHKYGCAAESYESAVKQSPKAADFWYLLGLNLLRSNRFDDAVPALQKSIELNATVLKPHLLLATALEELHRQADARAEWLAALKIDPHSEMALEGASKNFLATQEFQSVITLLGPQPKREDLILDLALAYRALGNPDEAIDVLRKGLATNPKSGALTRELITNLFNQRRFQEAAMLAKRLVERSPTDLTAKTLYLQVLVLNDDMDMARPLAKKLFLAAPHDFAVLYLNGVLANKSGDYSDARSFLEKAITLNPDQYDCRYNLGIALANLNDPKGAREQFEKALAVRTDDPALRFEYVKVLRTLGDTALAAEQFKLYQQEQKSSADRTQAASSMGQGDKQLAAGNPERAADFYREAITRLPDYALLHYKLSVALDQMGDIAGERSALQKAVQFDPSMAIAHRQLGYLAFNDADFTTAEAEFRSAVKAAPGFADAWVSLAATLATESRHQEAQEAVERALAIDPQNKNAAELQKELAKTNSGPPNQ